MAIEPVESLHAHLDRRRILPLVIDRVMRACGRSKFARRGLIQPLPLVPVELSQDCIDQLALAHREIATTCQQRREP